MNRTEKLKHIVSAANFDIQILSLRHTSKMADIMVKGILKPDTNKNVTDEQIKVVKEFEQAQVKVYKNAITDMQELKYNGYGASAFNQIIAEMVKEFNGQIAKIKNRSNEEINKLLERRNKYNK